MIPGVSAGSNQVGAIETCTPQVICPSGAAATGGTTTITQNTAARVSGRRRRRGRVMDDLLSSEPKDGFTGRGAVTWNRRTLSWPATVVLETAERRRR